MTSAIVVDTMVASAWLGPRTSQRQERWTSTLGSRAWVLPFTVVAEMRFGAEIASWGPRRRSRLENLVAQATVAPPLDDVAGAYVDLRTWCTRVGHGLGARHHEADRWVAATALAGRLPLASDDGIFTGVPALVVLDPRSWP